MTNQPQVLIDPCTGRPILMSPGRQGRPRDTGADAHKAKACPFCEGQEQQTTKEVAALRKDGSKADQPGWTVRAFGNLYPAATCHEVIAEGPTHTTHPCELSANILSDSLQIYRQRMAVMDQHDEVVCSFLFKNVGAEAGSSIAHNHSQLLGLPVMPPRLVAELAQHQNGGCHHCHEITEAKQDGRLIHEGKSHVILSPRAPKLAYEIWLLPKDHGDDFLQPGDHEDLVDCLHMLYQKLHEAFGPAPFNHYLHRIVGHDFHWHLELQPRVGQLASLELGGDMYINAVTAQMSTAKFRGET